MIQLITIQQTLTNVKQRAASIVASQPECKLLAKKAFLSYMRSVALMPNKEVHCTVFLEAQ
jgi:hypothetical protein